MGRNKRTDESENAFRRKLFWTILFGIVFGAGLITGQRLVQEDTGTSLVSVQPNESNATSQDEKESANQKSSKTSSDKRNPVFSFYDRLSDSDSTRGSNDGSEPPAPSGAEQAAKYTLQLSAHGKKPEAKRRIRRLSKMGLDPYVVATELPDKGTYYRVRIGKFTTMEAARTFKKELQRKRGVESTVTPL